MKKSIVVLASVVLGVAIVAIAFVISQNRGADGPSTPAERPVASAELQAADGKDGRPCLVAVDGMVYQIDGFALWQDGEHIPSEGQAMCGADLSEVMRTAPHGTTKLDLLVKVGPLQP